MNISFYTPGVVIGDIPQKTDFEVPEAPERPPKPENMTKEHPEYEEYRQKLQIFITAASKYRKAVQKNMDLRSLRCSALLKFEQADKFKGETWTWILKMSCVSTFFCVQS